MKHTKNTTTTIRINSEIKKIMEKDGITAQQIIDEYIKKNFTLKIIKKG